MTAATATSRRFTRSIATATFISASGKAGQQQQDEQGAVVGVVGAEHTEHLRGQQAGDHHRGDQERADQPRQRGAICAGSRSGLSAQSASSALDIPEATAKKALLIVAVMARYPTWAGGKSAAARIGTT